MIYLILGEDRKAIKRETQLLIKAEAGKKNYFDVLDSKDISYVKVMDLALASISLFEENSSIIVKDFIESLDWEQIRKNLKILHESNTKFFFVEKSLNKTDITAFEKIGAKIKLVVSKKEEKTHQRNPFQITNFFENKEVFFIWKTFIEEIYSGEEYYSLSSRINWKIRDMIQKKNFKKWTNKELVDFSQQLIEIESQKRNKGLPMEYELERLLLNIKK